MPDRPSQVALVLACRIARSAGRGAIYGVKVRFLHSFVAMLVFSRAPWTARIKRLIRATISHAVALAMFASVYKSVVVLLCIANGHPFRYDIATKQSRKGWHALVAGAAAGLLVFGNDHRPMAEQLVLIAFSHASAGAMRSLTPVKYHQKGWQITSAVAWAAMMYFYQNQPENISTAMLKSMQFLYGDP